MGVLVEAIYVANPYVIAVLVIAAIAATINAFGGKAKEKVEGLKLPGGRTVKETLEGGDKDWERDVDKGVKQEEDLSAIQAQEDRFRRIEEAQRGVRRKYTKIDVAMLEEIAQYLRELFEAVREIEDLKKQGGSPAVRQKINELLIKYQKLVGLIKRDMDKLLDALVKQKQTLRKNIREEIKLKHAEKHERLVSKKEESFVKHAERSSAIKKDPALKRELDEIEKDLNSFRDLVKEEGRGDKKEIRIFKDESGIIADELSRITRLKRIMESAEKRVLPSSKIEEMYREVEEVYRESRDVWGKEKDEELVAEKIRKIEDEENALQARIKALEGKVDSAIRGRTTHP